MMKKIGLSRIRGEMIGEKMDTFTLTDKFLTIVVLARWLRMQKLTEISENYSVFEKKIFSLFS